MGDRPMTNEQVAAAVLALGRELAYPPAPSMRSAVTARLENERAAGARPAFPGRALWSRRRVLVLATIGLLAALALAAAARFAIGAIERLSEPERLVVMYRYLLELSEAETARALAIRPGTVKSRLSRALSKLRHQLEGSTDG